MPKEELIRICDDADMIIKGYAFKRKGSNIEVFNVNDGFSMMVMTADGILTETNMNEIEQALVKKLWSNNAKYMEDINA